MQKKKIKSETDPRTTKRNTSGKSSGDHAQKNLSSDGSATYKPAKTANATTEELPEDFAHKTLSLLCTTTRNCP